MNNIVTLLDKSQGIIATIGGLITIITFFGFKFKERIFEIGTFNYRNRRRHYKNLIKISYFFLHLLIFLLSFIILFVFRNVPDNFGGILTVLFIMILMITLTFFHKGEIPEEKLKKIKKRESWNFIDRDFNTFIYFITEFIEMGIFLLIIKTQISSIRGVDGYKLLIFDGIFVVLMIINYFNYRISNSMIFDNKYNYSLILKDKVTCLNSEELLENKNYYFLIKSSKISEDGYDGDTDFISELDNKEITQVEKKEVYRVICNIKTLRRIEHKK